MASKREMARIPLFGQLYALTGHLLIDRGNLHPDRGNRLFSWPGKLCKIQTCIPEFARSLAAIQF